jgi:hypothetical protein
MKNKMMSWAGILSIIFILVFGLNFSGCKTENDEKNSPFEGTWRITNSTGTLDLQYIFKGNTYRLHDNLTLQEFWYGTFEYTDTTITFIPDLAGELPYTHDYSFNNDNNVLRLETNGNYRYVYGIFYKQ